MVKRLKHLWPNLSQSLGFIPGVLVVAFGAAAVVLVEVDKGTDLDGVSVVFQGDASAARTVLSVIAGSLITVAGLTFSITMVVLQLASSQFSPRILRTFFGDRLTQVTIGTFAGTFAYSLLVLREVESFGDAGFVPRLSITVATLLGIAAVLLLVAFLQHVSQLVQVSHVSAAIAHETLARVDALYPSHYGEPIEGEPGEEVLAEWRLRTPGRVFAKRPGFVQRVELDGLEELGRRAERIALLVCPGDFVSVETPIAEVWPESAGEACRQAVRDMVSVASERDLNQDADFGIRQLADTALRAISPGINDPMTAVTCIRYVRSILVRITARASPPRVREFPDRGLTAFVRRRRFDEHLESLLQLNRYADGDAWVIGEVLATLQACARTARECGAAGRLRVVQDTARVVAEQARREVGNDRDRACIDRLMAAIEAPGAEAAEVPPTGTPMAG